MGDFVAWAKPDFGKFGQESSHLGDAFAKAIAALKDAGDMKEDGANEFPTQWFECFANPIMCLMVYFVPCYSCCLMGRTLEKVDSTYERELLSGCVTALLYCGPCYHASRRTALRKKYNLKGSKGMDCILSCFCGACLMCQEAIAMHKYANLSVPFAFPPDPNAKPPMPAAPAHAAPAPLPAGGPAPGAAYMVPPPTQAPPPGMAPPPAGMAPPPAAVPTQPPPAHH